MASYVGNNDFRGYLAYLAQAGDQTAAKSLNYTGNDGGVNDSALNEWNTGMNAGEDQAVQANARNYVANAYQQWQQANAPSYSGGGGGGGTDYSGALAGLDKSEGRLRSLLGQADTTLDQGLSQLLSSFTSQQNKANQDRSRTLEDFQMKRDDTTRAKDSSLGTVDTNARNLNDSLRRILGLASGTGSSAFQLAAPGAVAREASQKRAGVLSNFGENFRNLGVAEDRAKTDFDDLLTDLMNQKNQKEYGLRSGTEQTKQGIFAQLGDIASQRSAIRGGGTAAQIAAAQPYEDQYNEKQNAINQLFSRFAPSVTAKQVNPQQVNLQDYTVDRAAINANRQFGTSDPTSPYAQFLKRQREQLA